MALDTLCHEVAAHADALIKAYAHEPKSPARKGKPAVYRSDDEVRAFIDRLFGGDGKQYEHSLAELYGPGENPHDRTDGRDDWATGRGR